MGLKLDFQRWAVAICLVWMVGVGLATVAAGELVIEINITDPEFQRSNPTHSTWRGISHADAFRGNYYHDNAYSTADLYGTWTPNIVVPGTYNVYLHWVAHPNRSDHAPVTVRHAHGVHETFVDQRQPTGWHLIGTFEFSEGRDGYVRLHSAPGYTIFDGARFELVGEPRWPEGLELGLGADTFVLEGDWTWKEQEQRRYVEMTAPSREASATWYIPDDLVAGSYEVLVRTPPKSEGTSEAMVHVKFDLGLDTSIVIDQATSREWTSIGRYDFTPGMGQYIRFVGTDSGIVAAEGVRWILGKEASPLVLSAGVSTYYAPSAEPKYTGAIPVTIERDEDGRFYLLRGGAPFFVKGVAGAEDLDAIASSGGNALRTYSHEHLNGYQVLDEAYEKGIGVVIGLWLTQQDQGIDYSNPLYKRRIAAQLEQAQKIIMSYKDHPAVIAWAIGNEVDKGNADVWYHINEIAAFVHEHDPAHPTVAMLAGSHPARVETIRTRAPHIDIIGVNTYTHIGNVYSNVVHVGGWDGPYFIAEWGPDATYEVQTVNGIAPIEAPSDAKADQYYERYQKYIVAPDVQDRVIGSFAFKLAHVAATTHTWYNLLLEDSKKTPQLDEMIRAWTGQYPENRAPRVRSIALSSSEYDSLTLDPRVPASVVVQKGERLTFVADVWDPDDDPLEYQWIVARELVNGVSAVRPPAVRNVEMEHDADSAATLYVTAPANPGDYRLYLYVYDGNHNVGTHTFPFRVQ